MQPTVVIPEQLENVYLQRQVKFVPEGYSKEKVFRNLQEFVDFIQEEADFWSQLGPNHEIYKRYDQIRSDLKTALQYVPNNMGMAQNHLNNALNIFQPNRWPCLTSISPSSKKAVSLFNTNGEQYQAFVEYLKENKVLGRSVDYMTGVIDIVISKNAKSILTRTTDNERIALSDLRDQYLVDREELNKEFETLMQSKKQDYDEFKKETAAWQSNMNDWQTSVNDWQKNTEVQISEQLKNGQEELTRITQLYTEQMILKGPAAHWEQMKKEYRNQGITWIILASLLVCGFITLLLVLLYDVPSWVVTIGNKDSLLKTIKGTVLLTLIISTCVYLIRLFVRLSLSAFHLSRDARERLQLTNVYLSLLSDNSMADSDRGIVLQALFSRADTGLLKGDTAPTMPDAVSFISSLTNPK